MSFGDDDYQTTEAHERRIKRHRWSRGCGWMVCLDCHCRYRTGNLTREYEQPDGSRTAHAGPCVPRAVRSPPEPPEVE